MNPKTKKNNPTKSNKILFLSLLVIAIYAYVITYFYVHSNGIADENLPKVNEQHSSDGKFTSYWEERDGILQLKILNNDRRELGAYGSNDDFLITTDEVLCSAWDEDDGHFYTVVNDVGSVSLNTTNNFVFYSVQPVVPMDFFNTLVHGKEILLISGESGANFGYNQFAISPDCKRVVYYSSGPKDIRSFGYDNFIRVVNMVTIQEGFGDMEKNAFETALEFDEEVDLEWVSNEELTIDSGAQGYTFAVNEDGVWEVSSLLE